MTHWGIIGLFSLLDVLSSAKEMANLNLFKKNSTNIECEFAFSDYTVTIVE